MSVGLGEIFNSRKSVVRVPSPTNINTVLIVIHVKLEGLDIILLTKGIHKAEDIRINV